MTEVRSASYLQVARSQLEGGFLPLLLLLGGLFILAPIVDERTTGRVAVYFLISSATVAAIFTSVRDWRIVVLVLVASALAWAALAADEILDASEAGIPARVVGAVLLILAPATVLSRVLRSERVTFNTIYGALCVYLLLGLFWAAVFFLIQDVESGSFEVPENAGEQISDFLYFSIVTQTTLGYGDITPVSGLPRLLAALQAFSGQVFLVVTVARLVSLQIAYSGRAGHADSQGEAGQARFAPRTAPDDSE